MVLYSEALDRSKPIGKSVAVIGAGGVGFDVAEFLAHGADMTDFTRTAAHALPTTKDFLAEWGIDDTNSTRGGLLEAGSGREYEQSPADNGQQREIYLLQRKKVMTRTLSE